MRRLRQQPSVVSMTDLMIIIPMKRLTGKLTIGKARVSKEKYQRADNVKLEEAKKSELHYKMLSNLLNEKDEAEAYFSSTVLRFLIIWQEATRDEKAKEAQVATTYWQTQFDRIFWYSWLFWRFFQQPDMVPVVFYC
jgi:hypothetical protein